MRSPSSRIDSFQCDPRFSLPSTGTSSSSSSLASSSSSSFWMSRTSKAQKSRGRLFPASWRTKITRRQSGLIVCLIFATIVWFSPAPSAWYQPKEIMPSAVGVAWSTSGSVESAQLSKYAPDPIRWLRENSDNRYAENGLGMISKARGLGLTNKPKAALISLVRNSELDGIVQSMQQVEYQWNHKYNYPWVFFNDESFSDEFKATTQALTSAKCYYETVPEEHWLLPDWIDEGRFMDSLEYLGAIGVGKGWMISYRHMCRWNSGFFYKHPRLMEFDWYWRIEPDVTFTRSPPSCA